MKNVDASEWPERANKMPAPADPLVPTHGTEEAGASAARSFLSTGTFSFRQLGDLQPRLSVGDWASVSDRRKERLLYSLMAIEPWSRAWGLLTQPERSKLQDAVESVYSEIAELDPASGTMAFHDETTAQRLLVTNGLVARMWGGDPPDAVRRCAARDVALLMDDEFYAGLNNHGMFQDVALLVDAANTAGEPTEKLRDQVEKAANRASEYFSVAFTDEGVHIEHTPTYHVMIVRALYNTKGLLRYLEERGYETQGLDQLDSLLGRSAKYATHMIGPDLMFPYYSDTTRTSLDRQDLYAIFGSSEFEFAASGGRRGVRPAQTAICFPKSGYAVYRSRWEDPQATFVLFTAAYNGGYHKHSDELSLIVQSGGRSLLIEAGPNGYNYDDPDTKYAFSSLAHNSLIVDGRGLPRVDKLRGQTQMVDSGTTDTSLDATGHTSRYKGVSFSRRVSCNEGIDQPILIQDHIDSTESHEYRLLWHLGPDLEPRIRGDHVELMDYKSRKKIAELYFKTSAPYELVAIAPTDRHTRINRWFPSMGRTEFAWTLETVFRCSEFSLETTLRTSEFGLAERQPPESEVRPAWQVSDTNPSVRYFVDEGEQPGPLIVAFPAVGAQGDFTYNYRRTLESLPGPKMFLLDDWGDQGAYCYAHGRDRSIFDAVQAAIAREAMKLGQSPNDIVTVGSSKGGTSALIHGLALGVDRIVVGAPQTRIGTFVSGPHPNILEYMAGGTGAGDIAWLDTIVEGLVRNAKPGCKVTLLVGKGDHHYKQHAVPAEQFARASNVEWNTVAVDGMPHSEIGPVYASFLRSFLLSSSQDRPPSASFALPGRGLGAYVETSNGEQVAARLLMDNETVDKVGYRRDSVFEWKGLDRGIYRVRLFVRGSSASNPTAFTLPRTRV